MRGVSKIFFWAYAMDSVGVANFTLAAFSIIRRAAGIHSTTADRRFRALFGTTPTVCVALWKRLSALPLAGGEPQHLLWGLMFLRVYASEVVHATMANADEKTFRKWAWIAVKDIASLNLVL